jgi:hypothetical protein
MGKTTHFAPAPGHCRRIDMLRDGLFGVIAGAAGTMALDVTTYGDMVLRGRAPSNVPATVAGALADRIGITALSPEHDDEAARNRRTAVGALLGYATGLGIGGVYGMLRGRRGRVSTPLAGVALGLLAMTASDLPIALTGASDPRTWSPVDWASDLIPHLVYGFVTAAAYEAIAVRDEPEVHDPGTWSGLPAVVAARHAVPMAP